MKVKLFPKAEDLDIKKLREDLKRNIGSEDGLTVEHLKMNDRALIVMFISVYGRDEINNYLIPSKMNHKYCNSFEEFFNLKDLQTIESVRKRLRGNQELLDALEEDGGFAIVTSPFHAKMIANILDCKLVSRNSRDGEAVIVSYIDGFNPINNEGYLFSTNDLSASYEDIF